MTTTTLIAIPVMSIDRATLGSASLFTSQAIRPPTHPMRIGRSHQAPLTRRFGAAGGAQALGAEGVERAVAALFAKNEITPTERDELIESERLRVEPEFNSTRYGRAAYCQLAATCAVEITTGAEDESEMGAFHDLFQPQRATNLRTRLAEYTPAGINAGIIFAT